MSNELLNRNKLNVDADLLAAREEARRVLSDDALAQVVGGNNYDNVHCPNCGGTITPIGSAKCLNCGTIVSTESTEGDERDMDEAFADIDGLLADIDGWD